jgi:hypothetical protein
MIATQGHCWHPARTVQCESQARLSNLRPLPLVKRQIDCFSFLLLFESGRFGSTTLLDLPSSSHIRQLLIYRRRFVDPLRSDRPGRMLGVTL